MSLTRDSRTERKIRAWLNSQLQLKQKWERIDFDIDVVKKTIDEMKAGKPVMGLPADAALAFDVVIDNAVSDSSDRPEGE